MTGFEMSRNVTRLMRDRAKLQVEVKKLERAEAAGDTMSAALAKRRIDRLKKSIDEATEQLQEERNAPVGPSCKREGI